MVILVMYGNVGNTVLQVVMVTMKMGDDRLQEILIPDSVFRVHYQEKTYLQLLCQIS
jgi:hypothetical protein